MGDQAGYNSFHKGETAFCGAADQRHYGGNAEMGLPNRHVGTLEMSRLRFPRLPNRTLETGYLHLFHDAAFIRQNHRALDDARMTAKIWLKLEGG